MSPVRPHLGPGAADAGPGQAGRQAGHNNLGRAGHWRGASQLGGVFPGPGEGGVPQKKLVYQKGFIRKMRREEGQ